MPARAQRRRTSGRPSAAAANGPTLHILEPLFRTFPHSNTTDGATIGLALPPSLACRCRTAGPRELQGQLITTEGRAAVAADPLGEKFPWLPEGAEAAQAQ